MKFRNFKLWIGLFALIAVIGSILYQQSLTNRQQLETQAIKGMEITKKNVRNAYRAYHEELESYLQRWTFARQSFAGDKRHEVAIKLNELFGSNRPDILAINYVGKDELSKYRPSLNLLENGGYYLLDSNYRLQWDPTKEIRLLTRINPADRKDFSEILANENNMQGLITSRIPLKKLMEKDQLNRFFDRILLTDDQGIVVYPEGFSKLKLLDFRENPDGDSENHIQAGVQHGSLEISGLHYKGFWTPIYLNGQTLYLLGIKEAEQFNKVGLRINFTMISTLIFSLIFLLCSIPIIGLLNLGKGDVLSQSKVFSVGLSLMVLMVVIGFAASFHVNLDKAVASESDNFRKLPAFYKQQYQNLEAYLDTLETGTVSPGSLINTEVIELLEIEDGNIQKLTINGMEGPLDFGTETSFIHIGDRNYVSYFYKDSLKKKDNIKHYIDSHYSRGSGKLESVISRYVSDKIFAVTFSFKEIDSPAKDSRFVIIKQDGKVLYKTDKILTPLDSLQDALPENKWTELRNLMSHNAAGNPSEKYWEIPLYLNGNQYVAVLQLLDNAHYDQPLWTIYLVSKTLNHIRSSLISIEAGAFLSLYLLLLILITFVNRITKPRESIRLFQNFTYSWLYPTAHKSPRYMMLIILFLIYIILLVIAYAGKGQHPISLLMIAGLLVAQASISLYLLAGPHWEEKNILKDDGYLFLMGLIWFVLLFGLIQIQAPTVIPLLLLTILILLVILKQSGQLHRLDSFLSGSKNKHITTFVGFMCLWSIIVGFLPGYIIHSKTNLFEKNIWNKKGTLSYTAHNKDWINEYEKYRRGIFSLTADQFDSEIEAFIAPERDLIYQGMNVPIDNSSTVHQTPQTESSPVVEMEYWKKLETRWVFIPVLLLILLFMTWLIYNLIHKIYLLDFDFRKPVEQDQHPVEQELFRQVYLCGLDNWRNRDWVKETFHLKDFSEVVLDDLSVNPNPVHAYDEFFRKRVWMIENIHCQADPKQLMLQVHHWIKTAETMPQPFHLILSSGIPWKELMRQVNTDTDRLHFSELFGTFFFEIIPIDYKVNNKGGSLAREIKLGTNVDLVTQLIRNQKDTENQLMLIQRYNKAFYANIWAELSFREKKVCYYLSQEGFLNPENWDTLTELVQKGILYQDSHENKLSLFNQTFRHFILTHVGDKEITEFKADEKAYGNTNTIQVASISFILIALALISYFDKNFLNDAYAYLSGIFGILGSLYALLNKGISTLRFGKAEAN